MKKYGIDISKHQGKNNIQLNQIEFDFAIVKATEGIGYVDPYCDKFIQQLIKMDKPWGFYHLARPVNDPIKEARFFYENTKNYFGHGLVALDWEMERQFDTAWAKKWLDEVQRLSRVKPLIYMSESVENKYNWSNVVLGDYGLWIAKYPPKTTIVTNYNHEICSKPRLKHWKSCAIWQFAGDNGRLDGYPVGIDCDVFYGDVSAWNKYANNHKAEVEKPSKQSQEHVTTYIKDGVVCAVCPDGCEIGLAGANGYRTLDQIGNEYPIVAKMNANYFTYQYHLGVEQGLNVNNKPEQKEFIALWIDKNNEPQYELSNNYWLQPKDVKLACSPYSITIYRGEHLTAYKPIIRSLGCPNKENQRTAISALLRINGKWTFAVHKAMTPREMTEFAVKQGADFCAIFDGGGSTSLITNDKWKFKTNRKLASALVFYIDPQKEIPKEEPKEENIQDPAEETQTDLEEALSKNKELLKENVELKLEIAELKKKHETTLKQISWENDRLLEVNKSIARLLKEGE